MRTYNNVNDNVFLGTKKNNDNVIDRAKSVESIANQLVDKFSSPESRPFYCKVAYSLPENKIWLNYESAQKGNSPARLFNFLCRKDMQR